MTDALWITPGYPWTEQPVGGIFYRTQAEALGRRGLQITVVSPTPWAPWPLTRLRPRWRTYANAPRLATSGPVTVARPRYLNVPGQPSWALPDRMIARAAWRARDDWAGARLIHGHSVVEGLAAWRLAQRAKLPYVLTFHGSDMNTWPDTHPDRLSDLRAAVGQARAVIAVSSALAERVREVTGVSAIHLPIGVNVRAIRASALGRAEARRALGLPEDRIVVLFVGHLIPAKGVRALADAVVGIGPPLLGVFVGAGPETGYRALPEGRGSLLRYEGEKPHDDVMTYMAAADVLVLPSHSEGLPTVLVEAGALGLPVLASSVGGIPELLGSGRGTVLPGVSAPEIAGALRRFIETREEAEEASRRFRDHVLEAYDVDANTARLQALYESVTGTRPSG